MSNATPTSLLVSPEDLAFASTSSVHNRWLAILRSPLWLCFLVAVLARVWLIVHTNGVFDGDEATVGIQAEHILRGELPVYYYGQPYLGSLQAYVIAFIFLFTGPAVWAMRIEPIFTSLFIVYLTWRFSAVLADAAHLSSRAKLLFMTIAALVAAFAPLYDAVEEMKVTGGYIEAFAVMLWLLFCAFRLTQRWHEQASRRELVQRWAGLGFLIGFGLWIDPLVAYAYATIAIWIGGYFFLELVRLRQQTGAQSRLKLVKEAFLCVSGLPTMVLGFTPGIIWGAQNNWKNIIYIFQNGGSTSANRLYTILKVQEIYTTCLAPRAMGGALSTQPDVTPANPHILTFGLVVVGCALALSIIGIGLSLLESRTLFVRIRQLTLLPLLFFLCVSAIFSVASISTSAIYSGCGPVDYVGRYTVALVIALPFLVAAAFIVPLIILQEQEKRVSSREDAGVQRPAGSVFSRSRLLRGIQAGLLAVLALYFCTQGVAYAQADPNYTFHPTGCVAENPTDVGPILSYLQSENIHYAWASSWIGNRITFLTNEAIIATDWPGRVAANGEQVLHSDRPGIILLGQHNGPEPELLRALDADHITYHIARFYAEPGIDVLVVTSLSQTISPLDPTFASVLKKTLIGCWPLRINRAGNNDKPLKTLARTIFSLEKRKRSGYTRDC